MTSKMMSPYSDTQEYILALSHHSQAGFRVGVPVEGWGIEGVK